MKHMKLQAAVPGSREAFVQMDGKKQKTKMRMELFFRNQVASKQHSELPYELHEVIVDASMDIATRIHKYRIYKMKLTKQS